MKCELKLIKRNSLDFLKTLSIPVVLVFVIWGIIWWCLQDYIPSYIKNGLIVIFLIELCIWYYRSWVKCKIKKEKEG